MANGYKMLIKGLIRFEIPRSTQKQKHSLKMAAEKSAHLKFQSKAHRHKIYYYFGKVVKPMERCMQNEHGYMKDMPS